MGDRSIGRADIESSATEPNSPNPALATYYRQQLEQLYAEPSEAVTVNDTTGSGNIGGATTEQAQGGDKEEYDFRLFKRPSEAGPASVGAKNVLQRIALRSPSPANGISGFTSGGRPDKYYFAGDAGGELAEQYAQVAVSGQDIMEGLKMKWNGMELPWRVTVIKATLPGKWGLEHHTYHTQAQSSRRKRSGKKRRVIIRKKFEARAAKEVAARRTQTEKEAAEREKRTRKNREKKVKKRQKDKLKKAIDVEAPA